MGVTCLIVSYVWEMRAFIRKWFGVEDAVKNDKKKKSDFNAP